MLRDVFVLLSQKAHPVVGDQYLNMNVRENKRVLLTQQQVNCYEEVYQLVVSSHRPGEPPVRLSAHAARRVKTMSGIPS